MSCKNCPDLPQHLEARRQAGYWHSCFKRAQACLEKAKLENAQLQAKINNLNQRLFGTKSESRSTSERLTAPVDGSALPQDPQGTSATSTPPGTSPPSPAPTPRRKGQQRGSPIPKRRDYSSLVEVLDERYLPADKACCPSCQLPFAPMGFTDPTTILEIEVRAYRRTIKRQRYRPRCVCHGTGPAPIIAAPAVPRVLPKSPFGVSIWTEILLDKFAYYRPTYRLLGSIRSHGLDLSPGTVTGGLQQIAPLFEPIYKGFIERSRLEKFWHADESRWPVFEKIEGKATNRWYMWLFESGPCAVFALDKGRAKNVPQDHFGKEAKGIVMVDRYSAYKAIWRVKSGKLILAFCWAHVRRDFLKVEKGYTQFTDWSIAWLTRIAGLYHLNRTRLRALQRGESEGADIPLRDALRLMAEARDKELADENLHPAKRKVLQSLMNHWKGLTVFVDHPEVPMDNNKAERTVRRVAQCRHSFLGSGAVWSGNLTATMFSLMATLAKWGLCPRKWLMAYLQACADAGGESPKNIQRWLPWNMSEQEKQELKQEPQRQPQKEKEAKV